MGNINVQHNFYKVKCPVKKTKPFLIECQQSTIKPWQLEHSDTNDYLISAFSFHNTDMHHQVANLPVETISNQDGVYCISEGLSKWGGK